MEAEAEGHASRVPRRAASSAKTSLFVDTTKPFATVPYPHTTAEDMAETVRLVEEHDRPALSIEVDVRGQAALDEAVAQGVAQFDPVMSSPRTSVTP